MVRIKKSSQKIHFERILNVFYKQKKNPCNQGFFTKYDTGGRGRTDTPKEHDFESCASANSATPA